MNKYQSALREVPLFSDFSAKELKVLEQTAQVRQYGKGDEIVHRSEEGDTFFSILEGKVKVILTDDESKEYILGVLRPKEFFGELALLDGEPRSATVVALEETEVLALQRDDFLQQIKKHPELCIKLMIVLGRRLRKANQSIESLAFKDVCGRLAEMILDLAESTGENKDEGILVPLEYSRTELAHQIGTTRETLTRALKTLQSMGNIQVKRKSLLITSEKGLRDRI
ncbi:MAG: Crp/Fnr family transcriptional regulator [bacterium]